MRTFFFVLIGAVAELGIFREHLLLMAGTLGSLFLARFAAIHSSRWAWRRIAAHHRELIFWVMPRGLITVVLAFAVAQHRGTGLTFVPGLAFAVILTTNAVLVLASFRARRAAARPAAVEVAVTANEALPAPKPMASRGPRHRWVMNAALLLMLAAGGVMLWYADHSSQLQPRGMVQWIRTQLHRGL